MKFEEAPRAVAGVIGSKIRFLPAVSSTNDYLLELQDGQEGLVVVADLQTAGRGRGENRWTSPAGKDLLFSFQFSTDASGMNLSQLPLLASLAVCEALDDYGMGGSRTKWPNDVLLSGKKLCGILIECQVRGRKARLVAGIGLNVNQTEFPPEIAEHATSLALAGGTPVDRVHLFGLLLDSLNLTIFHLGREEALRRYRARCSTIGTEITYEIDGVRHTGLAVGIDDQGRLLVDDGGTITAYSGSEVVHLRSS